MALAGLFACVSTFATDADSVRTFRNNVMALEKPIVDLIKNRSSKPSFNDFMKLLNNATKTLSDLSKDPAAYKAQAQAAELSEALTYLSEYFTLYTTNIDTIKSNNSNNSAFGSAQTTWKDAMNNFPKKFDYIQPQTQTSTKEFTFSGEKFSLTGYKTFKVK
jgi:molecular chaperone DnaK (HSP70)